jgi:hypothetical protein
MVEQQRHDTGIQQPFGRKFHSDNPFEARC